MSIEGLRNEIAREVQRALDRRSRRIPCSVDSYNPATHAVKVKRLPEGDLTGWIPLESLQSGAGFGVQIAPNIGETGWLEFHEADRRAAVYVGSSYNDKSPPSQIQAGEMLVKAKWGQSIYLKQDGSLTLTDGQGASIVLQNGIITFTDKSGKSFVLSGDATATTNLAINSTANINTTADVSAGTISLKNHIHSGVKAGGDTSAAPVA